MLLKSFCRVLDASQKEISKLKLEVDAGNCIPQFGLKADQICLNVSILPLVC